MGTMNKLTGMEKADKWILGIVFGAVIPIFTFLLFWWSSVLFIKNNKIVLIIAVSGLLLGLLIDYVIKRFLVINYFKISLKVLTGVYIFYSACFFGFFMGVPIFHPILGIIAGYYWGRRLIFQKANRETFPREIRKVSLFTSIIISCICLLSATFALIDSYTADNLEGMLNLSFEITHAMLVGLIIIGGLLLIGFQYWITKMTIIITLKLKK